jgi:hypothetical protein
MSTYKLSYTGQQIDAGLDAAFAAAPQSTTYTKSEVDASQAAQNESITSIQASIDALRLMMDATVYGLRIDKNNSDPETRVEYLYDAVGMTPARMNYTTGVFDYGSWENAWFITGNKPCALKFDGTVDYELDPDDYTKKADGTASDVSDSSYAGNFMASIPTVWVKRWEDADYQYYALSDKQINSDFKAYAHDAGDGYINDVIYLPMFEGTIIDGKMRSIADVNPTVSDLITNCKSAAEACGTGWQIWDWAKYNLIVDLLTLISRSTDSQKSFGYSCVSGSKIKTGSADSGRFYGKTDKTHAVKIFHIENFWGNCWNYMFGINLVSNQYVYKMARPYSVVPDSSYAYSGLKAPVSGGPISYTVGDFGSLPKTIGGSSTTYFCDRFYSGATEDRIGKFGGSYSGGVDCGAYTLGLHFLTNSPSDGTVGSPCYNAPHSA